MTAMRGIGLASIKKALRDEMPGSDFMETSKASLAKRYATGKMSLGGHLEHQRFRRMDVEAFSAIARQIHQSRPRIEAH